jgi:hypothetical protein
VPTYYDESVRQAPETWRSLRRRRARPPVPAGSPEIRVETFRSALEQAEQQFRAAASVDYDSRALNLYYGVSQAGRAVAAAATGLGQDEWTLQGHGLKARNLVAAGADVSLVIIKPDGDAIASFTRLSQVLGSPLPGRITLGELWPLMYETTLHVPLSATLYWPLHISLRERMGVGAHGIDNADIELPPTIMTVAVEQRPSLADFLDRYPALQGWRRLTLTGSEVGWQERGNPLRLQWELTELEARSEHVVGDRLARYRGHRLVFPAAEGQGAPLHPLMVWWAVLYALSMLTRYQPAEWTKLVDVNRSEQATAVEFVLDAALDVVPDLLDEAIDLVSERGVLATP